jgi:hypothetical protein
MLFSSDSITIIPTFMNTKSQDYGLLGYVAV